MGAVYRQNGKWYSWVKGETKTTDWGKLRGKIDRPKSHVEKRVHQKLTGNGPAMLRIWGPLH